MKITDAIAAAKTDGERAIGAILSVIGGCSAEVREIIEQDLEQKDMGLDKCFAALREHARKHQKGGCWACPVVEVTPGNEAVKVICAFYKIPNDWSGSPQSAKFGHSADSQMALTPADAARLSESNRSAGLASDGGNERKRKIVDLMELI